MTEQCNCHECTQARYRTSFQYQVDQALQRPTQLLEPEVSDGIRDLLSMSDTYLNHSPGSPSYSRDLIIEAYRRGKDSK